LEKKKDVDVEAHISERNGPRSAGILKRLRQPSKKRPGREKFGGRGKQTGHVLDYYRKKIG